MKKKRNIIILIVVLVLLCGWGIRSIYDNYQYGRELYSVTGKLSVQCARLVYSIDYLESEFEKADNRYAGPINVYHNAILAFWSSFGYDDMPIQDDVRFEWVDQFEKLRKQTMLDEDVIKIFTDEEKFKEVAHLRDQVNKMVDAFNDFRESYKQMSEWERYFVSWKSEQNILTEKVRFSALPQ